MMDESATAQDSAFIEYRPPFCYPPLQYADSIRLLHISPGKFNDVIICRLEEVRVTENPAYQALSYHWGDSTRSHNVLVTGEYILGIAANLFEALQYIRREDEHITLWADAICIDQENIEEKSHQIRLMSSIYQTATRVIVWLGPEDDDSRAAIDLFFRPRTGLLDVLETGFRDSSLSVEQARDLIIQKNRNEHGCLFMAVSGTFSTLSPMRRWWRRRWVIQELALAREAQVRCGISAIPWNAVSRLAALTCHVLAERFSNSETMQVAMHMRMAWKDVMDLAKIRTMVQGKYGCTKRLQLWDAVDRTRETEATDLRDTIYSLLSLCDFTVEPVIPDYRKTVLEVHIDAARVFLADADCLDPLCHGQSIYCTDEVNETWKQKERESIPSWLPQIIGMPDQSPPVGLYNANGHQRMSFRAYNTNDVKVLRLQGVKCDSVRSITRFSKYRGCITNFRRWQADNESILNQGSTPGVRKATLRIRYKFQKYFLTRPPSIRGRITRPVRGSTLSGISPTSNGHPYFENHQDLQSIATNSEIMYHFVHFQVRLSR